MGMDVYEPRRYHLSSSIYDAAGLSPTAIFDGYNPAIGDGYITRMRG